VDWHATERNLLRAATEDHAAMRRELSEGRRSNGNGKGFKSYGGAFLRPKDSFTFIQTTYVLYLS